MWALRVPPGTVSSWASCAARESWILITNVAKGPSRVVQDRLKLSGVTFVRVSVPSCGSASGGERNTGEQAAFLKGVGESAEGAQK